MRPSTLRVACWSSSSRSPIRCRRRAPRGSATRVDEAKEIRDQSKAIEADVRRTNDNDWSKPLRGSNADGRPSVSFQRNSRREQTDASVAAHRSAGRPFPLCWRAVTRAALVRSGAARDRLDAQVARCFQCSNVEARFAVGCWLTPENSRAQCRQVIGPFFLRSGRSSLDAHQALGEMPL
jgi:hypothetical protein